MIALASCSVAADRLTDSESWQVMCLGFGRLGTPLNAIFIVFAAVLLDGVVGV